MPWGKNTWYISVSCILYSVPLTVHIAVPHPQHTQHTEKCNPHHASCHLLCPAQHTGSERHARQCWPTVGACASPPVLKNQSAPYLCSSWFLLLALQVSTGRGENLDSSAVLLGPAGKTSSLVSQAAQRQEENGFKTQTSSFSQTCPLKENQCPEAGQTLEVCEAYLNRDPAGETKWCSW